VDDNTFNYTLQPKWASNYDPVTGLNNEFNYANIQWSIQQMEALLKRYDSHPALVGFEPVNEPY